MIVYYKLELLRIKEKKYHFSVNAQLYLKALKAACQELLELKNPKMLIQQAQGQTTLLLG